ncbi:MAG: apolipoprotein N-acyltransferase [Longimicrobiales bacterium]
MIGAIKGLWPRAGERLLPAVSALLLLISFPPLHLLIPPFLALVPFAVWVRDLPAGRQGAFAAMRGGALLGALYFGTLLYWIFIALVWFSKLAALAYVGTVFALALAGALFGWAMHRMLHGARIPLWLALPIAWTAVEWLRAHLPAEFAFPWLGLGTSLTGYPELVGIAELIGARGVTFWLVLINGLLAELVIGYREGWARARGVRRAVVLALVVILPMAWGVWRAETLELRPATTVTVVQPNIAQEVKLSEDKGIDSVFIALGTLMPLVPKEGVDLVVWPEVTVSAWIELNVPMRERVSEVARIAGAPVVFGSIGHQYKDDGSLIPFNSAFMMDSEGRFTDYRYDKRKLVPVVERTPLPSFLGKLNFFGSYGRGTGWPLGETANGARFGMLICYESTYPDVSREFRRAGAEFLINITNDAWYGREVWYARTTALWQHPSHLVMRAIENRVGIARSANTGISFFVDPVGRIYDDIPLFSADVRTATVLTTDVISLYTRWGDVVGTGAALSAVLLLLLAVVRGFKPELTRSG